MSTGFTIRRGDNEIPPGISAVRARLENDTLRVLQGSCPNLLAEADLYRYEADSGFSEKPIKEYDHAMDALRYLVSEIHPRVPPDDVSWAAWSSSERLTLQTSTGPNPDDPRFVVVALPG